MKKIYIETYEDLNNLRYLDEGEYLVILCNDLDLKGKYIRPIDFKNTNVIFDGNLHSITNLNMQFPFKDNVGLFNTLDGSLMVVKDLDLSGNVEGRENVGLLGGTFNGVVNNSYFLGSTYGYDKVGGLVGKSTDELILNDCTLKMSYPDCEFYQDDKQVGYVSGIANRLLVSHCIYDVSCDKLSSNCNEVIIKPKKILKRKKD